MFSQFKQAVQHRANTLIKNQTHLFLSAVDRDLLWMTYLLSYPEEEQQGHNCNACRSFIKHYGILVAVVDNKLQTVWDLELPEPFGSVAQKMNELIQNPIN